MTSLWQEKRPFEETNIHMLNENVLCEVTFVVGSKKAYVTAHRFMLASRSPVFYAMFCGEMSETRSRIEITDIEADTMNMLLRFIYTEECVVTKESVMALMYAAKKYNIKRLKQKCETYLSEHISHENVCDIFTQAHMFCEMELKQKCFNFILNNAKLVLQTEGFTTSSKELLREILRSDNLFAPEVDIYDGCKKWATHQLLTARKNWDVSHSDIRKVFGDLIYLIRFPTMSTEEFTTRCSEDDILTSAEKVSIFQAIMKGANTVTLKFVSKKRTVRFKKHHIPRLSTDPRLCMSYSERKTDAIDFSVSEPALFCGIGLFTRDKKKGTVEGTVSLLGKDRTMIKDKTVSISYADSREKADVLFDETVPLLPDDRYTIKLRLNGSSTYYGVDGPSEVVLGSCRITFSDSQHSTNVTSVLDGQIPYLILGLKSS